MMFIRLFISDICVTQIELLGPSRFSVVYFFSMLSVDKIHYDVSFLKDPPTAADRSDRYKSSLILFTRGECVKCFGG